MRPRPGWSDQAFHPEQASSPHILEHFQCSWTMAGPKEGLSRCRSTLGVLRKPVIVHRLQMILLQEQRGELRLVFLYGS